MIHADIYYPLAPSTMFNKITISIRVHASLGSLPHKIIYVENF